MSYVLQTGARTERGTRGKISLNRCHLSSQRVVVRVGLCSAEWDRWSWNLGFLLRGGRQHVDREIDGR